MRLLALLLALILASPALAQIVERQYIAEDPLDGISVPGSIDLTFFRYEGPGEVQVIIRNNEHVMVADLCFLNDCNVPTDALATWVRSFTETLPGGNIILDVSHPVELAAPGILGSPHCDLPDDGGNDYELSEAECASVGGVWDTGQLDPGYNCVWLTSGLGTHGATPTAPFIGDPNDPNDDTITLTYSLDFQPIDVVFPGCVEESWEFMLASGWVEVRYHVSTSFDDLLGCLVNWGLQGGRYDMNDDGVGTDDLLFILSRWHAPFPESSPAITWEVKHTEQG